MHPTLRHVMAWRCRFMSASEVPKSTQKLVQPIVVAGLHRRVSARHPAGSLRSTIDRNDGRWQVEARRGHGPHGRGRRRVRWSLVEVHGRWRATMWSPCRRLRRRRFTPTFTSMPRTPSDFSCCRLLLRTPYCILKKRATQKATARETAGCPGICPAWWLKPR